MRCRLRLFMYPASCLSHPPSLRPAIHHPPDHPPPFTHSSATVHPAFTHLLPSIQPSPTTLYYSLFPRCPSLPSHSSMNPPTYYPSKIQSCEPTMCPALVTSCYKHLEMPDPKYSNLKNQWKGPGLEERDLRGDLMSLKQRPIN